MQRLFSTFANGWPGAGLLIQRIVTAITLLYWGIHYWGTGAPLSALIVAHLIGAVAGILLLIGLWTPVAGTVVAMVEVWAVVANADPWVHILLATLGAALAMIGPGAWSIDARLFGRKHLET